MLADIKAAGLDILVDCADCVYTDSQNEAFLSWLSGGYHFRMKRLADIRTLREPIIKISACRMDGVQAFLKPLEEKYGERLKITLSGQQWIDTMDPQVNKGNAVRILQEGLQISPTETFAFGDQLNDIEMLESAYYSAQDSQTASFADCVRHNKNRWRIVDENMDKTLEIRRGHSDPAMPWGLQVKGGSDAGKKRGGRVRQGGDDGDCEYRTAPL